ncbi:MAG: glycosyltransferase family 1 protein [Bacteroidales bacterium]|nr:glycosyltransferase family 1 protein [Bacteroidales bacterium]
MALTIAVNTRLLIKNKLEGIGWFTYENLKRIVRNHPEVNFYFFFDRQPDAEFIFAENVTPIVLQPPARHPFLFIIWFEWSVNRALKRLKPDLFLSPDGYLSLLNNTPDLAVMHDLNFEHFPKDLPFLVRKYYRWFFPRFAQKASRIATVSTFSKNDIAAQYGVPLKDIDVVYNGVNERFTPISAAEIEETKAQYASGSDYFLFVGSLHPRKNLVRLFKAFDLFCAESDQKIKLMVVGEKKWWTAPIRDAFEGMKYQQEVVFCGRLNAEQLHKVTASAFAITYVSYFEGFGIPIVEAFRCGVPVITANVTSMPEVAGDAALLVDPFSEQSIAEAMHEMANNSEKRLQLIEKGLKRAKLYSWDKAAQKLWESILTTIDQSTEN